MHLTRSVLLSFIATAGVAHADDREAAARDARMAVEQFASSVNTAMTKGMLGGPFYNDPADCTRAVEAGNKAGIAPTDTFEDGDGSKKLWKRAPAVCTEYARLRSLSKTLDEVHPMLSTAQALREPDGSPIKSMTADAYRAAAQGVKPCVDIIDRAVKAGVPADIPFLPNANWGDTKMTLTEVRKVCSDFLGFGEAAAAADEARAGAEVAAAREKYGKLGIKGDRLEYLVKWGHRTILGKGCVELTGKALKTAPAFYDLGDDGIVWTVYKTQFKGDKQVKYTVKRFRRDGDYQCK